MISSKSTPKLSGVTLIMVAGVLAILAALGAGFYTLMLSSTRSAMRFSDSVSAELSVSAGIADAVARLREETFYSGEDPASRWFTVDYLHGAARNVSFPQKNPLSKTTSDRFFPFSRALSSKIENNSEQYSLSVTDAASKININAGDNLGFILDNLCRVIGKPLVCADLDALQPRSWAQYGASAGLFDNAKNSSDSAAKKNWDLYYVLDLDHDGKDDVSGVPMPLKADGNALYGDGFAIAAYRSKHGRFKDISEVKEALTYTRNPTYPELEKLEIEVKFNALKDFLTIDSWVDTSTVCTGKFEWVGQNSESLTAIDPDAPKGAAASLPCQIFIDRDKSWVADDPKNDPKNKRGSLRGCYLAIINGHGAGQLRRIATNGIDWVAIKDSQRMDVAPGPISSYMIVAREDALTERISAQTSPSGYATVPKMGSNGELTDDPDIDYDLYPLCIHRAPININTASDKVLTALFMGIDIQHGHPMAVGTDADLQATKNDWKYLDGNGNEYDPHDQLAYVLKPRGLKRIPASSGRLTLNRPKPWAAGDDANFAYIYNNGGLNAADFKPGKDGVVNEAHELAYRVIMARTRTKPVGTRDADPTTADEGGGVAPYNGRFEGFERGPFKSWDDFYFRVVKPWDDIRSSYFIFGKPTIPNSGSAKEKSTGLNKASVARLIMANFNPNTDILKFNPNIEWIDRWGRNFTDMEAVMSYTDDPPNLPNQRWSNPKVANPISDTSKPIFANDVSTNNARGSVYLMPSNVSDRNSVGAGVYVIRNFRYRSDEMIDKTDLNRSTTEFSFDSKGIFEIQALGRVIKNGVVQAERKAEALVKVYDVWRETTQSQFVKGTIKTGSSAPACTAGTNYAGQITRDSVNTNQLLPLVTLPEPLVPLKFTINNKFGLKNAEVVDDQKQARDGYGQPKDIATPDVIANRVLPAGYDGQIMLATNTLNFDPNDNGDKDTFLASFNGDLDTDTCKGNGREQAKVPHTEKNDGFKYRVVDTCSLLGLMNDTLIDIDTDLPANPAGFTWTQNQAGWDGWSAPPPGHAGVYRFSVLSDCLKALNKNNYWENVTLRQGDLRTEGVYLSGPGVSGNESTIKYCFGDDHTRCTDSDSPGNAKLNFEPGSSEGNLITMWMKPVWHSNDHHTHPFFDATNPGFSEGGTSCRACYLKKHGSTVWALGWGPSYVSGNGKRTDDLNFSLEGNTGLGQQDGDRDKDLLTQLHGGYNWVPSKYIWHKKVADNNVNMNSYAPASGGHEESPSYRVQPFRWSYVGVRYRFHGRATGGAGGHWVSGDDGNNGTNKVLINNFARPFISTQTNPEQSSGVDPSKFLGGYWSSLPNAPNGFTQPCDIGDTGYVNCRLSGNHVGDSRRDPESGFGVTGQPCKWKWADPAGIEDPCNKIFGINNLNQDITTWIYHHLPEDGTYAVIDEFKISSRERLLGGNQDWGKDRGVREQTTSRYYLPPNPSYRDDCPTFTSQSMLKSIKGNAATSKVFDPVRLARVTWTVFTPRFLHENIKPTRPRKEYITRNLNNQQQETNQFRGPFDYDKYNEVYSARENTDIFPFGVDRPTGNDYSYYNGKYTQPQYNKGIEVEILNNGVPVPGSNETFPASGAYESNSGTFSNPDLINRFADKQHPVNASIVQINQLQYRVRFRYPVDQLVDNGAGVADGNNRWANPTVHYLLDSPVFDDISVTYMIKPIILSYRNLTE